LPFAEKQILAATLLEGQIFNGEKLIVRPKRRSKFPQSFFGSSPINSYFKKFRDNVAPQLFNNPALLNVQSVRKSLEENKISIEHLPNRMWCVHCTLAPQCHRSYCSFYHESHEKELGRILSLLAAEHYENKNATLNNDDDNGVSNMDGMRSHHTLIIQGLPKNITNGKIQKWFEVFGDIDTIVVHPSHTYLRMKRSQDARKIVHLLKGNNAKIVISFAPYSQSEHSQALSFDDEHAPSDKHEETMIEPFIHKKVARMNKKRKYHKLPLNGEWDLNGQDLNGNKIIPNVVLTSNASKSNGVNAMSNLNSIVPLSNSKSNPNLNSNINVNLKSMPVSMPFQTIPSIAAISSGQSISFPLQIIPTQVIPILSTTAMPTYMYTDHVPSIQTSGGMYTTPSYMFTHGGTPSYYYTPTDNSSNNNNNNNNNNNFNGFNNFNYASTPNLIHGLQSPLSSYYDGVHTPLPAIPMATPLLTGITNVNTNTNTNTNTNVNSNYIYNPILNTQREISASKMFNEQKNVVPAMHRFSSNDSSFSSMEHLFLAGNNTPHE
jgi:hypothetical protein